MVVDGAQVRDVLLGPDGAASGAAAGALCIDCSTIGRAETLRLGGELQSRGLGLLDAPVTGSSPRAEDGTLTIMAGGSPADFERAKPLLEVMGKLIVHCGPLGQGQMVKLINNAVAATNAAVLGQALVVGAKTGVDLDALIAVMGAGSGASAMLDLKASPMRRHDYATLFKTEHMLKDLLLCLEEAQAVGSPFPMAALTRDIFSAAVELGHADDDFAAIIDVIEREAGIRLDHGAGGLPGRP
jgi:3-hydroxyisobutyrate dehydrogenase-like beta-hydroxyacid dehydrogenase